MQNLGAVVDRLGQRSGYDADGRKILIGYDAVNAFLAGGGLAA